jgi:SAM-dependent methyltransferase
VSRTCRVVPATGTLVRTAVAAPDTDSRYTLSRPAASREYRCRRADIRLSADWNPLHGTDSDDFLTWDAVDASATPGRYAGCLRGYDADPAVRAHKSGCLNLLSIEPGALIVEVGSGLGQDARAMAERAGPTGLVVAVERSRTLIGAARSAPSDAAPPVVYVQGDALALPLPDRRADGCWVERTLQHVADPVQALRELIRVARPGARIVATEPDWDTLMLETGAAGSAADADEAVVSHAIAAHVRDGIRNPRIGAQLQALFAELGAPPIEMLRLEIVVTAPAVAEALLSMTRCANELLAAGEISADQAAGWNRALHEAGATRRFSLSVSCYSVVGVVPAS